MTAKRKDDSLSDYRHKRDFRKTAEPAGGAEPRAAIRKRRKRAAATKRSGLRFVIQKHQATSLHFDLRLEAGGVLKSWAVPKGLSLDPANKRLAMEVEDHPLEYGEFEGTIPKDEYGGGTVMIWDRGTYFADEAAGAIDDDAEIRREHEQGKISFFLEGERLRGSFALVRTDRGPKPKWLVIKHRDEHVSRDHDPVDECDTSVVTGRTMAEIAREESENELARESIAPMRAEKAKTLPAGRDWVYEELRDGTRVFAYITPGSRALVAEDGSTNRRFDAIADELGALADRAGRGFVLDGVVTHMPSSGLAYVVSDIVYDDGDVVLDEPWTDRRARIESLFRRRRVPRVRLAEVRRRAGPALEKHARSKGWVGIVAKRAGSPYRPGQHSSDWRRVGCS